MSKIFYFSLKKRQKFKKNLESLEKFFVFFNNYLILFIMRSSINLMKIKKHTILKKKGKYQGKSQLQLNFF